MLRRVAAELMVELWRARPALEYLLRVLAAQFGLG